MDKLLVPVDGSEPARRALRFAVDFAMRCGVAEIELLNVQPRVDSGLVRAQLSAQAIEAALRSMGDRDAGDIPCAPRRSPDRLPPARRDRAFRRDYLPPRARLRLLADRHGLARHGGDRQHGAWLGGDAGYSPFAASGDAGQRNGRMEFVVRPRAGPDRRVGQRGPRGKVRRRTREAIARQREKYAAQISETARRQLDDAGVPYVFDFQFGDPAETIAREATTHGCSHIVMGTRGLGSAAALVLGSVAYKTIHAASVPLTLVM